MDANVMDANVPVLEVLTGAGLAFVIIWALDDWLERRRPPIPNIRESNNEAPHVHMCGVQERILPWNRRSYEQKSRRFCRSAMGSQDLSNTMD